jgi:GntR family transcriptional regulator
MVAGRRSLLIPPLSTAAPGPLYQQIVDGLKREISEGRITAGAPLPSVRQFAEDLLVSVITVTRAYEELERHGLVHRRQGLGTFVSDGAAARSRHVKLTRARQLMLEALQEAREAGLSDRDARDWCRDGIAADGVSRYDRKRR